jgi:cytochrome c biogenesis protein CcmG/thiol:disulfide interchange protein DsbE
VLIVSAGMLTLLAAGLAANRPDRALDQALARGKRSPAPSLRLPSLATGRIVSLRAWRGDVVVVNVWASWCGPCRIEAPVLERWYRRAEGRGGIVLGIDTFDVTSDATSFIRRYHLTYPMLRDLDGQAKQKLGVTGFPESFVVDRSGRVAALERGPIDGSFMQGTVIPLLNERS